MQVSVHPTQPLENPALDPWPGLYGGVPPLDRIRPTDFIPALDAAMVSHRAELERIALNAEPPSFENTILALERSGAAFERVVRLLEIYTSTYLTEELQELNSETAPVIAAHRDAVVQDLKLFERVKALYERAADLDLDDEDRALLSYHYNEYLQAGAHLPASDQQALTRINQELASLSALFSQNLKQEENRPGLELSCEADFAGLPASIRQLYEAAALEQGSSALGIVLNTRSAVELFLEYSQNRALRERVWTAFVRRGDNGNEFDNNQIVRSILTLRAQKAQLLQSPSYAHWSLQDSMAGTPDQALDLMYRLWPAARARALAEIQQMQKLADAEAAIAGRSPETIAAWDYRYYAEKVRRNAYSFDAAEAREYLQLSLIVEGLFWLARGLFGYEFRPVGSEEVPRIHPDVRVYEVRSAGGEVLGLWYLDPFARAEKISGAWMCEYRSQARYGSTDHTLPLIAAVTNFIPGPPGEPVLLSWEDARTLIHEFGHSLHGLSSQVRHASLAGISVASDFVEFPSQLFEYFLGTPELLKRFAKHYLTGASMPEALIRKIRQSEQFNQGFAMAEYLASAILDMRLHLATGPVDPAREESELLAQLHMPAEIALRFRTPQFGHVFSEDGYAAGYYGYLWAEALSADAWEAFQEQGETLRGPLAERLRSEILCVGATRDPAQAYRSFRGRDPDPAALARVRGL